MSNAFLRVVLHQLEDETDDLARYRISASNEPFSGETLVWAYPEHLAELANKLKGFPESASSRVEYQLGTPKAGHCTLNFSCVDGTGHAAVWASLEAEYPVFPSSEYQVAFLCIRFEPAAIDRFCAELEALSRNQKNEATLFGL